MAAQHRRMGSAPCRTGRISPDPRLLGEETDDDLVGLIGVVPVNWSLPGFALASDHVLTSCRGSPPT